eukprot:2389148-Prymnesium_polylepis.1
MSHKPHPSTPKSSLTLGSTHIRARHQQMAQHKHAILQSTTTSTDVLCEPRVETQVTQSCHAPPTHQKSTPRKGWWVRAIYSSTRLAGSIVSHNHIAQRKRQTVGRMTEPHPSAAPSATNVVSHPGSAAHPPLHDRDRRHVCGRALSIL